MILQGDWRGCHRDGWQGLIVLGAFAHPAKFSRSLIRRIYDHMREEGWLPPGSVILDPFGGVALGALDAMRLGCQWIGLELEEKFVTLGVQNIALWNSRFASLPGWGSAVILQGDSRNLLAWNFAGPKMEAVVGSPPHGGNDKSDRTHIRRDERRLGAGFTGRGRGCFRGSENYGDDPSNLGNLPDKAFEPVVGSPPYEVTQVCTEQGQTKGKEYRRSGTHLGADLSGEHGYGLGDNLGNSSGDTFWSAARQILDQCFLAVRPGGHAVWVVKAFVRKGKRVDFPGQWRQLCEAAGFRCVHVHRALLVEDTGTQGRTDGGETQLVKERKSFFRRLAEKKGSPRIDWEEVQCFERP